MAALTLCFMSFGFEDPATSILTLCDQAQTCWHEHFTTDAQYQDCLNTAATAVGTCSGACAPEDTSAAIEATYEACLSACSSVRDGCYTACDAAYESAVTACGDFDDACVFAAAEAFFECEIACDATQAHCNLQCYVNEQIALASVPIEDARCRAECCNSDINNVNRQIAICRHTQDLAHQAASIAYWNCYNTCLDPDDGGVDSDCTSACQSVQTMAYYDADAAESACEVQANGKWGDRNLPCQGNWSCYVPCTATFVAAMRACIVADMEAHNEATYQACTQAANRAELRCTTECCYNLNGMKAYDVAALECVINLDVCLEAIPGSCPQPGAGPGEPCADPSSEECATATATWQACVNSATCSCQRDYKDALAAITDDPPGDCGSCVNPAAPDLTSCDA